MYFIGLQMYIFQCNYKTISKHFYKRLKISRNPVGQEEKTQLCGVSFCYSYSSA